MASYQTNLFVRLHRWAHRQDENFLTESFAYLIEFLVEKEPEAASELVARITGGIIRLSAAHIRTLVVRTQVNRDQGIPDIELRTADHFVIIEVKREAGATEAQLKQYRDVLNSAPYSTKGLVLLTRYPVTIAGADVYLRWYRIAEWIYQESTKYKFKAESQFLVEQFLGFLNARNMTMGQVTWEMTSGVRSLRNLVDMICEAAAACGLRANIGGTRDTMHVYLEGKKYWAGIRYSNPEFIRFATYAAKVDPKKVDELAIGSTFQWFDEKNQYGWQRDVNLEAEEVHFFARSKASQMQFLEQFLQENVDLAEQVIINQANDQATPRGPNDDLSDEAPGREPAE